MASSDAQLVQHGSFHDVPVGHMPSRVSVSATHELVQSKRRGTLVAMNDDRVSYHRHRTLVCDGLLLYILSCAVLYMSLCEVCSDMKHTYLLLFRRIHGPHRPHGFHAPRRKHALRDAHNDVRRQARVAHPPNGALLEVTHDGSLSHERLSLIHI